MALSSSTSSTLLQDAIQSVYTILVNQLCTKDIREDLFAKEIIDMPLKETIQNKSNSKEANEVLVDHLYKSGTVGLVRRFIQVLQDTSSSYEIHEETAKTLEGALRVHNVTNQSLPEQPESLLVSFGKMVRETHTQFRVVPPDMTTKELMFVELAVVKSSEHVKRKKDVTNFLHAAIEGIDKFYEQSQSIKYEDVLSPGKQKSGKRIVISGAPGCGKTTLSRKYCKDLSSGTLPNDYQLVILCHLREVSHCLKEKEQLTLRHFLPNSARRFGEAAIIKHLENSRGKGVLIILDGYDEILEQMKKSRIMNDILSPNSHYLDKCDLIVTTRPFTCPEVLARMKHDCVHVEILGFTEEKINIFIDNYFSKIRVPNKKMSDQLKERLQSLPSVQGMCRLPVVLKIICKVQEYLEDKGLPRTMGGIYKLYIKRQLLHASEDLKIANILEIPDQLLPGFSPLCHVSYDFSLTQKLVLSVEDLGGELGKHVKRGSIYELLFAESADDFDAASPVQLYMFLHKTIQEALAAIHVAKQTKPEQEKIWREQLGRPEMAEVWKFYCNFTKLLSIDFLSLLQASDNQSDSFKQGVDGQSGNMNALFMLSFFEADNENLSKHYLPQVLSDELTFHISSAYETVVLQYTLQHHEGIRGLKITSPKSVNTHFHLVLPTILSLQNLAALEINGISLNGEYNITVPERCLVLCQVLTLAGITCTPKQLIALLNGIGKDQTIKEICLSSIDFVLGNESSCDSLENAVMNLPVKTFTVIESRFSHEIGSVVSGMLQNRWIADLDINLGESVLTIAIPKECLVNCQKCYLTMSMSPKRWLFLLICIATSKTLKQIKLDISISVKRNKKVDPALYENVSSALKGMHSLKRFAVIMKSLKCPLLTSLLLGAVYNTSTTEVYMCDNRSFNYFQNLWQGNTNMAPVSSSLKCTLYLRLAVHEWVDMFLCMAQSERLEQIKVSAEISEGFVKVDQSMYENVTSYLNRMLSLKRFAVFNESSEYPLLRSLLLGTLRNASTTEVFISDRSSDHKEFHDHWSNSYVVPGSLSLKCTLHLMRRVHEWIDVFLCIAQSPRLEQIRVEAEINDREVDSIENDYGYSEGVTKLKEAYEQCNLKEIDVKLSLLFLQYEVSQLQEMTAMIVSVMDGIAAKPQSINFKVTFLGGITSANKVQSRMSPSLKRMFKWSENECILKKNQSFTAPLSNPNEFQEDKQLQTRPTAHQTRCCSCL